MADQDKSPAGAPPVSVSEQPAKPAVDVANPTHDATPQPPPQTSTDASQDQPAAAVAVAPQETPAKPSLASANAPAHDAHPPSGHGSSTPSIDDSKPADFEGELATNNELPSPDLIKQIENYIVLDKDGKSHTFKSLYSGANVPRRVLVIFVRHFFCGNCQDYLRTLCESISSDALLQLPISTFITVVGCGDPGLIDMYTETTGCTFPIYTDPTRSLFQALGMIKSWTPGPKPAYSKRGLAKGAFDSIGQALRKVSGGLLLKSGNFAQVGGEFLFEPLYIDTPISTPQEERMKPLAPQEEARREEEGRPAEEKRVTWCHRMRTTRDHAEIPELMEILGLNGTGRPSTDEKRWTKALHERKGTGLSMARQMSQMSNQAAEPAT